MNDLLMKFYPQFLIKDYEHWALMLRHRQVTPGSLNIVIKDDTKELGDVRAEQWVEFATVCADLEAMLKKAFGAEKFNYLALMMKDPIVHFHVIPRYSKPVHINGREFTDADWPLKTELMAGDYSNEDISEIRARLETCL